MSSATTRQKNRAPVTLKIKFKSSTLEEFVERYAVDISQGGIFIRTKKPLEVGTPLRFEFQLKDATPLIVGEGTVVWTREYDPGRTGLAPGMGVRFDRLPGDSQRVLGQILNAKKTQPAPPDPAEEFVDSPTKVAPRAVIAGLAEGSRDSSPPQFGGDEHAPLDAFDEATKVGLLDDLVARTAEPETDDEPVLTSAERMPTDVDGAIGIAKEAPRASSPPASFPEASDAGELVDLPTQKKIPSGDFHNVPTELNMAPPPPAAGSGGNEKTLQSMSPPSPGNVVSALKSEKDTVDIQRPAAVAAASMPLSPREAATMRDDERTQTTELPPKASSGSSAVLFAVAVLILIGVAGGGYWIYTKWNKSEQVAVPTTTTPADPAEAAGTNPEDPQVPPEPTRVSSVVASEVVGARATLAGGDQSGATPFTFKGLQDGVEYTATISAPGHISADVTFKGGESPEAVLLDAKPRFLKVASTPVGASVYVNGRRQKGAAPLEVEIAGALAKVDEWRVELRHSGYKSKREMVLASASWDEEETRMVRAVELSLEKREPVVVNKPKPKPKPGDGDGDGDGDGSGTKPTGDGDGDGDGDGSGAGTGSGTGAGTGSGSAGGPTPDWAKKGKDKDKDPATEPDKKPEKKPDSAPTPPTP